jgi:hypothetical protein
MTIKTILTIFSLLLLSAPLLAAPPVPPAIQGPQAPAHITGPLADVPAGQILLVHVPQAAKVLDEIDRLLDQMHLDASQNPLRRQVDLWTLGQPLPPDSSVTICLGPPAQPGGPLVLGALVTRLNAAKVVGKTAVDEDGIFVRPGALPAMVFGDGTVAVGDRDAVLALFHASRGLAVSPLERDALADADVLIRFDVAEALGASSAERAAQHNALAVQAGAMRRLARSNAALAAKAAAAERRLQALDRFWAGAGQVSAIVGGLMVNRQAVDARLCLTAAQESPLAGLLDGHPMLAGELNPPLPSQNFAALGCFSFEPQRLASLLQWTADLAVDHLAATAGDNAKLGPAELVACHGLFADWGKMLGGRAALMVPMRPAGEPLIQADGLVELAGPNQAAAFRGRLPELLDALTFLTNVVKSEQAPGRPSPWRLRSSFEPAIPHADPPVDRWRLSVSGSLLARGPAPAQSAVSATPAGEGGEWPEIPEPQPAVQLVEALIGGSGLNLWITTSGAWAGFSVAPSAARLPALLARSAAPLVGQAADEDRTLEALRHVAPRSNAVFLFSPSELIQLLARSMVINYVPLTLHGEPQPEIPIVESKALSVLSLRAESGCLSGRFYIPVTELAPVVSDLRAFDLLLNPASRPAAPAREGP